MSGLTLSHRILRLLHDRRRRRGGGRLGSGGGDPRQAALRELRPVLREHEDGQYRVPRRPARRVPKGQVRVKHIIDLIALAKLIAGLAGADQRAEEAGRYARPRWPCRGSGTNGTNGRTDRTARKVLLALRGRRVTPEQPALPARRVLPVPPARPGRRATPARWAPPEPPGWAAASATAAARTVAGR